MIPSTESIQKSTMAEPLNTTTVQPTASTSTLLPEPASSSRVRPRVVPYVPGAPVPRKETAPRVLTMGTRSRSPPRQEVTFHPYRSTTPPVPEQVKALLETTFEKCSTLFTDEISRLRTERDSVKAHNEALMQEAVKLRYEAKVAEIKLRSLCGRIIAHNTRLCQKLNGFSNEDEDEDEIFSRSFLKEDDILADLLMIEPKRLRRARGMDLPSTRWDDTSATPELVDARSSASENNSVSNHTPRSASPSPSDVEAFAHGLGHLDGIENRAKINNSVEAWANEVVSEV